jgi:yeast amino acid transporter
MESPKLEEAPKYDEKTADPRTSGFETAEGEVFDNADNLQRRLGNRQIQLIAIGGSIGTALFVSINSGLYHGGPGSLLIAYFLYSCMLGLVNNCVAEMSTYMPVSGGFIRLAGVILLFLRPHKEKTNFHQVIGSMRHSGSWLDGTSSSTKRC